MIVNELGEWESESEEEDAAADATEGTAVLVVEHHFSC